MQTKTHKSTALPPPSSPSLVGQVGHRAIPQKRLRNPPLSFCLKWGDTGLTLFRDAST